MWTNWLVHILFILGAWFCFDLRVDGGAYKKLYAYGKNTENIIVKDSLQKPDLNNVYPYKIILKKYKVDFLGVKSPNY